MNYTVARPKLQASSAVKNKKGGIDNYAALRCQVVLTSLRRRVYAHLFTGFVLALKLHHSVDLGEEGIIASLADIHTRMDFGPALADNDRSCVYQLSIVPFHAEVLRIAISTVSGTSNAFFMSHF